MGQSVSHLDGHSGGQPKPVSPRSGPRLQFWKRSNPFGAKALRVFAVLVVSIMLIELTIRIAAWFFSSDLASHLGSGSPPATAGHEAATNGNSSFLRILCVGHSLTLGAESPGHLTYPAQLESRLTNRGVQARVFNHGRPGWSTERHLLDLSEVLTETRPQVIVLWTGDHDFNWNTQEPTLPSTQLSQWGIVRLLNWLDKSVDRLQSARDLKAAESRYSHIFNGDDIETLKLIAASVDPLQAPLRRFDPDLSTNMGELARRAQLMSPPLGMRKSHWYFVRSHLLLTELGDEASALIGLEKLFEIDPTPSLATYALSREMSRLSREPDRWRILEKRHEQRILAYSEGRLSSTALERLHEASPPHLNELTDQEIAELFRIAPELPSISIARLIRDQVYVVNVLKDLRSHLREQEGSLALRPVLQILLMRPNMTAARMHRLWDQSSPANPSFEDQEFEERMTRRIRYELARSDRNGIQTQLHRSLLKFKEIAEAHQVKKIILVGYHPTRTPHLSKATRFRRDLNLALELVAASLGFKFVSLERFTRDRLNFKMSEDPMGNEAFNRIHHKPSDLADPHLNAEGNALVAEAVELALENH